MNANKILSISKPEEIFSYSQLQTQWQKLRTQWHPDKNPDPLAAETFAHISKLYKQAQQKLASGTWSGPSILEFATQTSSKYKFHYKTTRQTPTTTLYIGETKLIWRFKDKKLFDIARKSVYNMDFPKDKEAEYQFYLPNLIHQFPQTTANNLIVIDRPKGAILLSDWLEGSNPLPPEHVAWLANSLYNTVTFLHSIGVSHNAILPEHIFVSLDLHTTHLLGGWEHSTKLDSRLSTLPTKIHNALPKEVQKSKIATETIDNIGIQQTILSCLGLPAPNHRQLSICMSQPQTTPTLSRWIAWEDALTRTFGRRRFVKVNPQPKPY